MNGWSKVRAYYVSSLGTEFYRRTMPVRQPRRSLLDDSDHGSHLHRYGAPQRPGTRYAWRAIRFLRTRNGVSAACPGGILHAALNIRVPWRGCARQISGSGSPLSNRGAFGRGRRVCAKGREPMRLFFVISDFCVRKKTRSRLFQCFSIPPGLLASV